MSISIRTALKNVASEQYNKTNLFFYIVLIFLCGLCGLFVPDGNVKTINSTMAAGILFYLIICFIMGGMYVVSVNNAILNKDGIIPNLFSEIKEIISKGLLYFIGCCVVMTIMMLIILVPFIILLVIQPLLGLIVIPLIFILGIYYLGFYFNFLSSLDLSDWFNLKKASAFIKKSGGKLGIYIWKFLVINIICLIVFMAISIPLIIILGIPAVFSPAAMDTAEMSVSSVSALVAAVVFGIGNIYTIDLTAQYIKEVDFKYQDNQTT